MHGTHKNEASPERRELGRPSSCLTGIFSKIAVLVRESKDTFEVGV